MLTLNPATMLAEPPHSKTKVLWVDLFNPTDEEKADAEGRFVLAQPPSMAARALTGDGGLGASGSNDPAVGNRACEGHEISRACGHTVRIALPPCP